MGAVKDTAIGLVDDVCSILASKGLASIEFSEDYSNFTVDVVCRDTGRHAIVSINDDFSLNYQIYGVDDSLMNHGKLRWEHGEWDAPESMKSKSKFIDGMLTALTREAIVTE